MKRIILFLFISTLSFCQFPRPYAYAGPTLSSGLGYQPVSLVFGGGVDGEYQHWFFNAEGSLDLAHKNNDNTGQDSGYTERAAIRGFFRLPKANNWFVGGGASYTFLHTQLYNKNGWHPRIGLGWDGKDWMRLQGEYVMIGTDHINAVQGAQFSVWFPSPRNNKHHLFFRETYGLYTFHTTITDFNNQQLVIEQTKDRNHGEELQMTIEYRF